MGSKLFGVEDGGPPLPVLAQGQRGQDEGTGG